MKNASLFLLALLLVLATAPAAQACCFYNHAEHTLLVNGPQVTGWLVPPSTHRCTDGTGGSFSLILIDAGAGKAMSNAVGLTVEKQGWVTVHPLKNGKYPVESKRKNGAVAESVFMLGAHPHGEKPGRPHPKAP